MVPAYKSYTPARSVHTPSAGTLVLVTRVAVQPSASTLGIVNDQRLTSATYWRKKLLLRLPSAATAVLNTSARASLTHAATVKFRLVSITGPLVAAAPLPPSSPSALSPLTVRPGEPSRYRPVTAAGCSLPVLSAAEAAPSGSLSCQRATSVVGCAALKSYSAAVTLVCTRSFAETKILP